MTAKNRKKAVKSVKSLASRKLSAKQEKGVKGGARPGSGARRSLMPTAVE